MDTVIPTAQNRTKFGLVLYNIHLCAPKQVIFAQSSGFMTPGIALCQITSLNHVDIAWHAELRKPGAAKQQARSQNRGKHERYDHLSFCSQTDGETSRSCKTVRLFTVYVLFNLINAHTNDLVDVDFSLAVNQHSSWTQAYTRKKNLWSNAFHDILTVPSVGHINASH